MQCVVLGTAIAQVKQPAWLRCMHIRLLTDTVTNIGIGREFILSKNRNIGHYTQIDRTLQKMLWQTKIFIKESSSDWQPTSIEAISTSGDGPSPDMKHKCTTMETLNELKNQATDTSVDSAVNTSILI